MLGLVVLGSRTWMWTTAAPALAASTQDLAICSGVTGTAGFFPGESAEPVTAHEMITLRCMAVILPRQEREYGTPAKRRSQPNEWRWRRVNHRSGSRRLASHCALR